MLQEMANLPEVEISLEKQFLWLIFQSLASFYNSYEFKNFAWDE